ncbi:hypothetical protein LTR56_025928 [Elasticomyces elasticus]|nr:hypothetical protein LTR56_025928 [Elasticomyces elasticus]KAK3620007.1 hypothetical protein LTR22_025764 [Elasticomyces elasticus]KAK4904386.1 hypothetical protein LTR49_026151 [Elasticomyces elasticus]KAK5733546.1 hypothetical protein LTS12_026918 [Elasticomyces elasticus]
MAYAKQRKDSYFAVFWLNIHDDASVRQSFATIANLILRFHPSVSHVSNADITGRLDEIVDAVLAWLSDRYKTRWLAIYDNYDNPSIPGNNDPDAVDIHRFLPDAYQGFVIITTRSSHRQNIFVRNLKSTQNSVDIPADVSEEALSAIGEPALTILARFDLETDPDVTAVVRRLDGLALALATTHTYLEQASVSLATYLGLYESSWEQLHQDDLGLKTYEDRTPYSTW